VVPDATDDPRFRDNPFVTRADGVRFYAGVPVVTEEGVSWFSVKWKTDGLKLCQEHREAELLYSLVVG
jgi:GAF domain-containing protein